jgi:hypothetical protein
MNADDTRLTPSERRCLLDEQSQRLRNRTSVASRFDTGLRSDLVSSKLGTRSDRENPRHPLYTISGLKTKPPR